PGKKGGVDIGGTREEQSLSVRRFVYRTTAAKGDALLCPTCAGNAPNFVSARPVRGKVDPMAIMRPAGNVLVAGSPGHSARRATIGVDRPDVPLPILGLGVERDPLAAR